MLRAALSILLFLMTTAAFAQHQILLCEDCRDVRNHPQDFGNYAFNELIEPIPDEQFSIFTTYSTTSYVWNTNNQYALVHLEDILQQTGGSINLGFISIPIEYSSPYVRIRVTTQYGDSISYDVMETSRPLVVGDSDVAPPAPPQPSSPPSSNTDSTFSGSKGSTSGEEIICCQDGAYYWYRDQPAFRIQFSSE